MFADQTEPLPVPGLSVLVVEDEFAVALLLEDMLADLGHKTVGPVAHLAKAVEMARREEIDLAILDVNINGGPVYPVASVLANRGIPFFFATGYGSGGLQVAYRGWPTLQKPFRRNDLREIIEKVWHAG